MRQQLTDDTLLAAGAENCRLPLAPPIDLEEKGAQYEEPSPPPHAYDPAVGLWTNRESANAYGGTRIDRRPSRVLDTDVETGVDHGSADQSPSNSRH